MENNCPEQMSLSSIRVECLSCVEKCPVCGGDNRCRVAKGHLYKGPCWCEEITVPGQVLRALATDRFEPACLCRICLEMLAHFSHQLDDPVTVLSKTREWLQRPRLNGREEDCYRDTSMIRAL
jgi:hypothetical protein